MEIVIVWLTARLGLYRIIGQVWSLQIWLAHVWFSFFFCFLLTQRPLLSAIGERGLIKVATVTYFHFAYVLNECCPRIGFSKESVHWWIRVRSLLRCPFPEMLVHGISLTARLSVGGWPYPGGVVWYSRGVSVLLRSLLLLWQMICRAFWHQISECAKIRSRSTSEERQCCICIEVPRFKALQDQPLG